MTNFEKSLVAFCVLALSSLAFATYAVAQRDNSVIHNQPSATSPFASEVLVPPGYETIYISGAGPQVINPGAAPDSVESFGNTAAQTTTTLQGLKDRLAKLGLNMGDVVQGRVFLGADPTNGGKMDYAGMNAAWMKFFGTPDQPNKPARAATQVAGLVKKGSVVEIELIAVKKIN